MVIKAEIGARLIRCISFWRSWIADYDSGYSRRPREQIAAIREESEGEGDVQRTK